MPMDFFYSGLKKRDQYTVLKDLVVRAKPNNIQDTCINVSCGIETHPSNLPVNLLSVYSTYTPCCMGKRTKLYLKILVTLEIGTQVSI